MINDNVSDVKVTVLAVGQGNANLIECYDEGRLVYLILNDCGGDSTSQVHVQDSMNYILEKMKQRATTCSLEIECDYYLDAFILSHNHRDHYNIMDHIIRSKPIGITRNSNTMTQKVSKILPKIELPEFLNSSLLHNDRVGYYEISENELIYLETNTFTQGKKEILEEDRCDNLLINYICKFNNNIEDSLFYYEWDVFYYPDPELNFSIYFRIEPLKKTIFCEMIVMRNLRPILTNIYKFTPQKGFESGLTFPTNKFLDTVVPILNLMLAKPKSTRMKDYIIKIIINCVEDLFQGRILETLEEKLSNLTKKLNKTVMNELFLDLNEIHFPFLTAPDTIKKELIEKRNLFESLKIGYLFTGRFSRDANDEIPFINLMKGACVYGRVRLYEDHSITSECGHFKLSIIPPNYTSLDDRYAYNLGDVSGFNFMERSISQNQWSITTIMELYDGNNCSHHRMIMPGDATEQNLVWFINHNGELLQSEPLTSNFLVAPHHGSSKNVQSYFKSLTVLEHYLLFLKANRVIISAGKNNKYMHPGVKFIEVCCKVLNYSTGNVIYMQKKDKTKDYDYCIVYKPIYTNQFADPQEKKSGFRHYTYDFHYNGICTATANEIKESIISHTDSVFVFNTPIL